LQTATQAKDAENTLLARLAIAHNEVEQEHFAAAIPALKKLSQDAESQGLKYEAVRASIDMGEALAKTKALPQARQELERSLNRTEKLGMRSLEARTESLLANVLRLTGSSSLALDHYHASLRLLDEIRKEAGNDQILQRADFAATSTEAKRWAGIS